MPRKLSRRKSRKVSKKVSRKFTKKVSRKVSRKFSRKNNLRKNSLKKRKTRKNYRKKYGGSFFVPNLPEIIEITAKFVAQSVVGLGKNRKDAEVEVLKHNNSGELNFLHQTSSDYNSYKEALRAEIEKEINERGFEERKQRGEFKARLGDIDLEGGKRYKLIRKTFDTLQTACKFAMSLSSNEELKKEINDLIFEIDETLFPKYMEDNSRREHLEYLTHELSEVLQEKFDSLRTMKNQLIDLDIQSFVKFDQSLPTKSKLSKKKRGRESYYEKDGKRYKESPMEPSKVVTEASQESSMELLQPVSQPKASRATQRSNDPMEIQDDIDTLIDNFEGLILSRRRGRVNEGEIERLTNKFQRLTIS